jgi:hypothetical protein
MREESCASGIGKTDLFLWHTEVAASRPLLCLERRTGRAKRRRNDEWNSGGKWKNLRAVSLAKRLR